MTQFDRAYQELVKEILRDGVEDFNNRAGYTCKAIPGAHFRLDLGVGFPLLTLRRIPIQIFVAEQIWFIQGSKDPKWLQQFTKIWDDFMDEDGTLKAAYGYRWRHHFGRDQLKELIEHLKSNKTSRHGVVVTWDPADDSLVSGTPKGNVPCPYTFTVNIIGDKVCLHNVVRSNDVYLGLPHDVAGFAMLQHIIAQELGLEVGTYSHSISNAHFYSDQYEAAEKIAKRKHDHPEIKLELPKDSFKRAEKGDVDLVYEITEQLKSQYNPRMGFKGIKAH